MKRLQVSREKKKKIYTHPKQFKNNKRNFFVGQKFAFIYCCHSLLIIFAIFCTFILLTDDGMVEKTFKFDDFAKR